MEISGLFIPTPVTSAIIPGIAFAGTGSGPGCGRVAVTSHRGFGSHGPEGVRQAGMSRWSRPVIWPAAAGRRGGRMSLGLNGARDMGPVDGATDTVTGAEAQSLPPPDAKGSGWVDEPPIIKIRLVVATLPSSRLLQRARCESRRGEDDV